MGNFFNMLNSNSSIGQYRAATAAKANATTPEAQKSAGAAQANAVIGGVMSGISGLTGILDTSLQLAQGKDASQYWGQLADMRALGNKQYTDYNSLANDMTTMNQGFTVDKGSLGPTDGEIGKGVASGALQGAMTGMQVGGAWGALAGAVVGGGSALAGGLYGKSNGKLRENILNRESENQRDINTLRFQNQADNIRNYNYGQMYAHRAANGGQIEIRDENKGKFTEAARRNHMTVQQFAKKVLAKENAAKYSPQMRRRANFARNAAGWKHADGGPVMNMFSGGGKEEGKKWYYEGHQ